MRHHIHSCMLQSCPNQSGFWAALSRSSWLQTQHQLSHEAADHRASAVSPSDKPYSPHTCMSRPDLLGSS